MTGQRAFAQHLSFKAQMLPNTCHASMTSMFLFLQAKFLIISHFKSHWRLDKGRMHWQFTCQPNIYPADTCERGNPRQLYVCL